MSESQEKVTMISELKEAIDDGRVMMRIAVALARMSAEKQRALLPKAISATEFLKKIKAW